MSSVGGDGTADLVPPDELVQLVQDNWPWSEWSNALAIALNESYWRADARADTTDPQHPCGTPLRTQNGELVTSELSVGYFQINLCNYDRVLWPELETPAGNVAAAAALWRERAWQPWFFSADKLGLL